MHINANSQQKHCIFIFHFVAHLFCIGGIVCDWVSDIPWTFRLMVLHESDISVIVNREKNRYFKHTKICIQKCNFPQIQFRWNYAVLLVASKCINYVKFGSAILLLRSLFWESLFEFCANVSLTNKKFNLRTNSISTYCNGPQCRKPIVFTFHFRRSAT